MIITSVLNLGKGIAFSIKFKEKDYSLIINETGKSWSILTGTGQNGYTKEYDGIKDEKLIKQLEKGFNNVIFIPLN
jgi:hypothetical protein